MAIESKSLQVNPKYENSAVEKMQAFGWTLLSSQEIYNRSQEFTGTTWDPWGATDNYETKTTHYVKLVFQRDTNIQNYKKIVVLEKEYEQLEVPKYVSNSEPSYFAPQTKSKNLIVGLFIFSVFSLLIGALAMGTFLATSFMYGFDAGEAIDGDPTMGGVFLIIGIIVLVLGIRFKKQNKKIIKVSKEEHISRINKWKKDFEQYENAKNSLFKRRNELIEEARDLLT